MNLYVYCVTDSREVTAPSIPAIQAKPARILEVAPFRVIVSDFEGAELRPTKENVFTHERVIDALMDSTTPLPFRFGVVVREEKLNEFLRKNAATVLADLEKVRDAVEMGVKVLLPAAEADGPAATGTEFLRQKQRRASVQTDTLQWVNASLVGLLRHSNVEIMPGTTKTMVRIAHLVAKCHLNEYKSNIETLVRDRTNCRFLTSGPWPPYSFISTPRVD